MVLSTKNKKSKVKPKVQKNRVGGFNTISLSVVFVLVSVILAFTMIVGLTIKISIDDLYRSALIDSLLKIDGAKTAINNQDWRSFMYLVNKSVTADNRIVYYVVTKQNGVRKDGTPNYVYDSSSFDVKSPNKNDVFDYKSTSSIGSFFLNKENIVFNEKGFDKNGFTQLRYDMARKFSITNNGKVIHFGILEPVKDNKFAQMQTSIWQGILILAAIMLFVALCCAFMLARSISKPLADMEKTVSKIASGDLSERLENTKYEELNKLVYAYNMMADSLQRLYSTLEATVNDRTRELKSAYTELQNTQSMMVHSEKMKSLGELVAGIMHEINNPINFIYGNMTHLSNYSNDLISIIDEFVQYKASLKPDEKESIEKNMNEVDYEFLKSDLPELIKSCKEGANRAKNIIQDLKSFSRMEEVAITDVDISHEIDMTLNILHNKIKNKAEVHKEYMENIPKIEAFGGQLNQVFMNILDNAVSAIEKHGDIWIRINKDESGKNIVLEIEDNGVGMDSETAKKVFDPFFTTKPVGQGTGLGMSITHKIIKNHQGNIRLDSKEGVGTKFIITLPLNINREDLKTAALSEGEK